MVEIRYTLLADGSSDRALIPILTWLLQQYYPDCAIQSEWADLGRLRKKPDSLVKRIEWSSDLYPCDVLFIHRDAEKEPRESRVIEIKRAIAKTTLRPLPTTISVIPVRMQEAWLLFDVAAIRKAASNPHGKEPLDIPPLKKLEQLADPKKTLYELLRKASGFSGRRLARFHSAFYAPRVSEFIASFAPLRGLTAFRALEADIEALITE